MSKVIQSLFFYLCLVSLSAYYPGFDPVTERDFEKIYAQIDDICNPTIDELKLVQTYLRDGERPYLNSILTFYPGIDFNNYYSVRRFRTFSMFKSDGSIDLSLHKVVCNVAEDNLDRCIVMYSSYNQGLGTDYVSMLLEKPEFLKMSGFQGHVLYRVGGWPNIAGGDLELIHVPYSFKICMIREAIRLGYKSILWLDSSIWMRKDYNNIFDIIESDGYYMLKIDYWFDDWSNERMEYAFNSTRAELKKAPLVAGGLFGINVNNPNGVSLFTLWHGTALELDGFLSPRMDQQALATIAYFLELKPTCKFSSVVTPAWTEKKSGPPFYIARQPHKMPPL